MTVYLLLSEPSTKNDQIAAIEAKLLKIIPDVRKIERIESIVTDISANRNTKVVVVFVSPTMSQSSVDNLITIAQRYRDRVFFVLVSDEISGANYKRLMHSGGADWVPSNGSLQEISEIIDKQKLPVSTSQTNNKPSIISFLPSMGGVGNTSIALEIALRIKLAKATRSWKICYIDLDFQTSHVCDYLDIDARFQIHELLDRPERLDEQLLGLFVSHHACGLDVFAAPRSKLDPCQISVEVLDPFLEFILGKYDYIVLDLPVSWFSWTVPTLENSDAIVMTGINTIPCLRQMKVTFDSMLATKVSPSKVAIVLNRVTQNLLGGIKRRKHVESVFPKENIFYIGEHSDAVERVNTGTPAALGGRYAKDFDKLLSFCTALRQAPRRETAL